MDIRVHLMQANLYQQLAAITGDIRYIEQAKRVVEDAKQYHHEGNNFCL